MKHLLVLTFAAAALLSTGLARAGNTTVDSTSNSDSASLSQSALHNNFNVDFGDSIIPEEQTVTYRGGTNTAVPLAAAVSFSSDYCGGTASGGVSVPKFSIGAAKPLMDPSCQAMRRAEKLGMLAVTAYNMKDVELAGKLKRLAAWQICTSDPALREACELAGAVAPSIQK